MFLLSLMNRALNYIIANSAKQQSYAATSDNLLLVPGDPGRPFTWWPRGFTLRNPNCEWSEASFTWYLLYKNVDIANDAACLPWELDFVEHDNGHWQIG